MAAPPELELEALVKNELREPVAELVRRVVVELVHEHLNGHADLVATTAAAGPNSGHNATEPPAASRNYPPRSQDRKTCRLRGRSEPDVHFVARRRVCRGCRSTQATQGRERKSPRPGSRRPEVSRPAAVGGLNGRLSDENIRAWLIDSGLAVAVDGKLTLTEAGAEAAAWA